MQHVKQYLGCPPHHDTKKKRKFPTRTPRTTTFTAHDSTKEPQNNTAELKSFLITKVSDGCAPVLLRLISGRDFSANNNRKKGVQLFLSNRQTRNTQITQCGKGRLVAVRLAQAVTQF